MRLFAQRIQSHSLFCFLCAGAAPHNLVPRPDIPLTEEMENQILNLNYVDNALYQRAAQAVKYVLQFSVLCLVVPMRLGLTTVYRVVLSFRKRSEMETGIDEEMEEFQQALTETTEKCKAHLGVRWKVDDGSKGD